MDKTSRRLRHVRLAQRPHVGGQRLGLAQFRDRQTPRIGVRRPVAPELVVPLVEVLRQLLDNL